MSTIQHPAADGTKRLLLVDDDETFCGVLSNTLKRRGYEVHAAHGIGDAMAFLGEDDLEFAVVDLNLTVESGLRLVPEIKKRHPSCRTVVLTGYASVATAIEAIKLGAVHYLTKPAAVDDIIAAFYRDEGDAQAPVSERPMSLDRLEWEHLNRVLQECGGNISAAARKISMHRRTLQRKLRKYPVKQ